MSPGPSSRSQRGYVLAREEMVQGVVLVRGKPLQPEVEGVSSVTTGCITHPQLSRAKWGLPYRRIPASPQGRSQGLPEGRGGGTPAMTRARPG